MMDSASGSSTSADRGSHALVGHGNNQSQRKEPVSTNGLRRSAGEIISHLLLDFWPISVALEVLVGHGNNQSELMESVFTNGLRRSAGEIISLLLLLVFGLITVGLEVKVHEHHWLECFGIVVAVLVHFVIEWSFYYWQCPHLKSNQERETIENTKRQEGPHEHDGTSLPIQQHQGMGETRTIGKTREERRLFVWWQVFFAFVVGVMFMIPLVRELVESGSTEGDWYVIKQRLDTVKRLVGIVKIMESAFVIWAVVVQEFLSLAAVYNGAVSLLDRSGNGSGRDNQPRQSLNLLMLQKLMQFQLLPILTVLVVDVVAVVCMGDMSLTVAQLLWIHAVVRLGELGLAEEARISRGSMDRTSDDGNNANNMGDDGEPLPIFNTTWRNALVQVFYLTSMLLLLHFRGTQLLQKFGIAGLNVDGINQTVRFNVFVLCIIFNLVSARRTEETTIFEGILSNRVLLRVVGSTAVLQVLLVEFGGHFSSTVKLSWSLWMLCIVVALTSWLLDWLFKRFCPALPSNLRIRSL